MGLVVKETGLYGKDLVKELREGVRDTDYRVSIAGDSASQHFFTISGPRSSLVLPEFKDDDLTTLTKQYRRRQWGSDAFQRSATKRSTQHASAPPGSVTPVTDGRSIEPEDGKGDDAIPAVPTDSVPQDVESRGSPGGAEVRAIDKGSADAPTIIERAVDIQILPEEEDEEERAHGVGRCGHGPGGSAELVFEVAAATAVGVSSVGRIEEVPVSYYEALRARGFSWVFITSCPGDADVALVRQQVRAAGLKLFVDRTDDTPEPNEGLAALGDTPDGASPYRYDPTPLELLRSGRWDEFVSYLQNPAVPLGCMVHFSVRAGLEFSERSAFAAAAALLLLPGLRIVRSGDWDRVGKLLPILLRTPLLSGEVSIPHVDHIFRKMAVWKYATKAERVLVCLNFTGEHAVANVVCPDAPDAQEGLEKIDFLELLQETTFRRVPDEVRVRGLHVILREYEIQVFSY